MPALLTAQGQVIAGQIRRGGNEDRRPGRAAGQGVSGC
jgi:hypothetical protein